MIEVSLSEFLNNPVKYHRYARTVGNQVKIAAPNGDYSILGFAKSSKETAAKYKKLLEEILK